MANLIRLKQIEGSTELAAAVTAGNAISQSGGSFAEAVNNAVSQSLESSLSQSIINIITNNVGATLPAGVVSGSSQIYISGTIGYSDIATDIEVAVISSSLSASQVLISSSISSSIATTLSGSLYSITILSSSVNTRLTNLESFSSSLDNGFATDAELTLSQSNINIDMGEW
jgi:hypothetical protein